MNKQIEALKMAIKAMEIANKGYAITGEYAHELQACKEALAETEKQKPVDMRPAVYGAWKEQTAQEPVLEIIDGQIFNSRLPIGFNGALYTHPAPSWQSLSDDNILKLFKPKFECEIEDFELIDFARAIEQSLKELNAKK